ncbi:hypothetical protein HPP92_021113 [Vanilla planifolia]|uniref:RING-type E3 ubiquitin transferase n=1 Tax=Vanilla planifolia TaxID=51239 RepID=A0A835PYI7_VANPL|nr:hypothetical protein HPP92_021113 [Vanilla planifolia]
MGNSLGCSASGERLVSAARDGDLLEARMLLEFNPCLAKYSTFGGLNSPLHFAAAKGHNDIVTLLLENGADVNCRNYCGQTALMQACRHGHWEVVQTLLLYRCNVTKGRLSERQNGTAFCSSGRHVRCIRRIGCRLCPSPCPTMPSIEASERDVSRSNSSLGSSSGRRYDQQWLPVDVARIWGRHAIEPFLAPNSEVNIPDSPPSNYLSLPLMSILNIAREWGLQSLTTCDDNYLCPVCLERACNVFSKGCSHEFCVKCALYLCSTSIYTSETMGPPGSIPCPLCRRGILSFTKLPSSPIRELKPTPSIRFCNPCIFQPRALGPLATTPCRSEFCKNREESSELICSPRAVHSLLLLSQLATVKKTPRPLEPQEDITQGQSPRPSQSSVSETDKFDDQRLERTSCSGSSGAGVAATESINAIQK